MEEEMKSITLETMIWKMAVNFCSDLLNPENGKETEKRKKERGVSERERELGAQEMVDFAGNRVCVGLVVAQSKIKTIKQKGKCYLRW